MPKTLHIVIITNSVCSKQFMSLLKKIVTTGSTQGCSTKECAFTPTWFSKDHVLTNHSHTLERSVCPRHVALMLSRQACAPTHHHIYSSKEHVSPPHPLLPSKKRKLALVNPRNATSLICKGDLDFLSSCKRQLTSSYATTQQWMFIQLPPTITSMQEI